MAHLANLKVEELDAISLLIFEEPKSPQPIPEINLYDKHCSSCHNSLDETTKKSRTTQQIIEAIQGIPEMSNLVSLQIEEIDVISQLIYEDPKIPLYVNLCESCHGDRNESDIRGKNKNQIVAALKEVEKMNSLKYLLDIESELLELEEYLAADSETDGNKIYANECSQCHDAIHHSTIRDANTEIIMKALKTVSNMKHIKLEKYQIKAIVKALSKSPHVKMTLTKHYGNRHYVASQLMNLFGTSVEVKKIINNFVITKVSVLGGVCRPRIDEGCNLSRNDLNKLITTADGDVFGRMSTSRRAVVINACEQILDLDTAIEHFEDLARMSLKKEKVTQEKIEKVVSIFFPVNQPGLSYRENFVKISYILSENNFSVFNQWREILKIMCSSPLMEFN